MEIRLPPDQEDHLAAIAANAGAPCGFTFLATIALPGERGRMTRASESVTLDSTQ
jgi:hypothetical protein